MTRLEFFCLVTFCFMPVILCDDLQTLKSISVTFRHGDRAPEPYPDEFYPNDEYKYDPMEPMGQGGLLNKGKLREYQIGVKLRQRYNTFLGNTYREKDISAISTNYERTEMSLALVLAGLYPPKGKQVWKSNLNWQPIPVPSIPGTIVGLVNPTHCPTYEKELEYVRSLEEYKKDLSAFDGLMKNLTIFTGWEYSNSSWMANLYHSFVAESSMNLELPKWVKPYFPDGALKEAALFDYKTQSYNTKLKKLNGGIQIRKMLNAMIYDEKKRTKKINLYSSHENGIASLLHTLNVWTNAVPEYGSTAILELHERKGQNYLKIVYYNSIPPTFETRIIPGCSEYCLIDDFLSILKDVIPDDVFDACFGPVNDSLLIPKTENVTAWIYQKLKEWYF